MVQRCLLFTDVVDSTGLVERVGDERAAALWGEHDCLARSLLAEQGGFEVDRSDGFFLVFEHAAAAVRFALSYHAKLATLGMVARVGLHVGEVTLRENSIEAVARGAKRIEVEGLAKPLAARIMSLARGGQTLLSSAARKMLRELPPGTEVRSHGHYRAKGIDEPIELFEIGESGCPAFVPPPDSEKVYRVVCVDDLWRPVREVRHNLAPERDAFVGRIKELRELARLLEGGARLVSVLGVGGTGKTRLVRRYGAAWLGEWPGGVYFCDLSEARSLEGIHFAVALALGIPLVNGDPAVQIGHAVAGRGRCLVILDNFEQVLAHAAATVGRWLDRAAAAGFIVTSRERLHLAGEAAFPIEPLALRTEAIDLFMVRARAQVPGYEFDDGQRDQVAEIVRLLDGLPLAVELAAARIRVLSPAQIVHRLTDRFQLLAEVRGAAARQATLRAAIDWSWELLAPWEQSALAQCAVFEGGFTLEAAEAVLELADIDSTPRVMDVVQSLVDKSLLRAWLPAGGTRLGIAEPLFGMYLTIHEYASDRLSKAADGARERAERRHGSHFAGHGSDALIEAISCHGGAQRRQALQWELDNLVAACRRALARGDGEVAVPTYKAAWEVLRLRGPSEPGAALGKAVLALQGLDDAGWLDAANCLADALRRLGRLTEARGLIDEMVRRARDCCDQRREGIALSQLAVLLREQGVMHEVRGQSEAALTLHRACGNRQAEATTLHNLGNMLDQIGDPEASRASHVAALALHKELGNRLGEAHVHSSLGILNRHQGLLHDSLRSYEAALEIFRELGDRRAEGIAIGNMANTFDDLGRAADRHRCLEEALEIHRNVGSRVVEAFTLANLGLSYEQQERWDEAHEHLSLALAIDREVDNRMHEGVVLANLGSLEVKRDRVDAALSLLRQALARHRETSNRLYMGITSACLAKALLAGGPSGAPEALAALREGEAELRAIDNPLELLELLRVKGHAWLAAGEIDEAWRAVQQADEVARRMQAQPDSRGVRELAALREAVAAAMRQSPPESP